MSAFSGEIGSDISFFAKLPVTRPVVKHGGSTTTRLSFQTLSFPRVRERAAEAVLAKSIPALAPSQLRSSNTREDSDACTVAHQYRPQPTSALTHQVHIAVRKLRTNKPLTATDLSELERMLVESGVGAPADLSSARFKRGFHDGHLVATWLSPDSRAAPSSPHDSRRALRAASRAHSC